MSLTTAFQIVFAAGAALAIVALAGAGFRLLGRAALGTLTTIVCAAAAASWVAFALRPHRELAVDAGGLTVAALLAASSLALARALARVSRLDAEADRAQAQLGEFVEQQREGAAAELERQLARARADSISTLVEEERRIAEERRAAIAERERLAHAELLEGLTKTQQQVEQRLQGWARDLERSAEAMRKRLADLAERQGQLLAEAETRLAADADRLQLESDEQREAVARLRVDVQLMIEETVANAHTELETHGVERRRALHEVAERLRRRERELNERIEREEADAAGRIQAGLADVQRRQIEQLERSVQRASSSLSDEAAQQFTGQIKAAREEAARRLGRELDRAVESFAREAHGVLAEQLAHVGDAGAQRVERRLTEITGNLDRQRDEFMRALESRFAEAEEDVRRRLAELAADAEAERAVVEARLQELMRRIGETSSLAN